MTPSTSLPTSGRKATDQDCKKAFRAGLFAGEMIVAGVVIFLLILAQVIR